MCVKALLVHLMKFLGKFWAARMVIIIHYFLFLCLYHSCWNFSWQCAGRVLVIGQLSVVSMEIDSSSRRHRATVSSLNDLITCCLCGGYYVDATAIAECLHTCTYIIILHLHPPVLVPVSAEESISVRVNNRYDRNFLCRINTTSFHFNSF